MLNIGERWAIVELNCKICILCMNKPKINLCHTQKHNRKKNHHLQRTTLCRIRKPPILPLLLYNKNQCGVAYHKYEISSNSPLPLNIPSLYLGRW